jgi:tetratricopeptide (TPR) repeat protein
MSKRLALSMIVRNGGEYLRHCLISVQGIVDEIVIADTGSTDSSVELARSFGAQVIDIPWANDFAAARNQALKPVTADWILSLDADEQLDDQAGAQIKDAMEAGNTEGYLVPIRNYVGSLSERLWDKPAIANDGRLPRAASYAGFLLHENVRLFRHDPEIYFEGRVHETVGARIEGRGGKLKQARFIIHHFGFTASEERRAEKNKFYRELGRQKIQEMPGNAQAHFELGLVEFDNFHDFQEAERLFARACELNGKLGVAWLFRAQALVQLQRDEEALPCFAQARSLNQQTAAMAEAEGDALYNCRKFDQARTCYKRAYQKEESIEVLSKLGLAEVRLGQVGAGLKKLSSAVRQNPTSAPLHDRLVSALISVDRLADAAQAADVKLNALPRTKSSFIRAAALWLHANQHDRALQVIKEGLKEIPDCTELRQAFVEMNTVSHPANIATD